MIQMSLLAIIIFGDSILPAIGLAAPPEIYESVKQNKMAASIGVYMVGNMIVQQLVATGSFEVTLDGVCCAYVRARVSRLSCTSWVLIHLVLNL